MENDHLSLRLPRINSVITLPGIEMKGRYFIVQHVIGVERRIRLSFGPHGACWLELPFSEIDGWQYAPVFAAGDIVVARPKGEYTEPRQLLAGVVTSADDKSVCLSLLAGNPTSATFDRHDYDWSVLAHTGQPPGCESGAADE